LDLGLNTDTPAERDAEHTASLPRLLSERDNNKTGIEDTSLEEYYVSFV